MTASRRAFLGTVAAASFSVRRARAQQQPKLTIGVLTDLSGPYHDLTGLTSVMCARQAVDDWRAAGTGLEVEVISADHRNNPARGAGIARQWIDQQDVDVIADVPNSAVALEVAKVCEEKDRILLNASAVALELTGAKCSPNTVVWSFDTYTLARSSGGAMVKAGGNSWFFITADYVFGHSLEEQTSHVIAQAGGKVLGHAEYPFPETFDFAPYLQLAAKSGAKVLGLANAGTDAINCFVQATELGLPRMGMRIAPLLMFINDVHALGLAAAGGMFVTETFYWDLNDRTRAFTNRVRAKTPGNYPNQAHASVYSGVLHYLKVAAAMGAAEAKRSGAATVARMKQTPTEDDAFGTGSIREDGRGVFPAYLFRVKTSEQSKGPWDLYELVSTTPASEAVLPLSQTGCKLASA
jgi:branched-chain amino acid transport system substrate-binding protein